MMRTNGDSSFVSSSAVHANQPRENCEILYGDLVKLIIKYERADQIPDCLISCAGCTGSLRLEHIRNRKNGPEQEALLQTNKELAALLEELSRFPFFQIISPESLAELLRNEHPQIVAAILVHLEYEQSAAVLMQLPERMRSEVMLRVATLEGIQPSALKDLNEVLYQVLAGGDKIRKTSLGGVKTAAEMMNLLGGNADVAVLDTIRNYDADLAQKIMDKMFVFDDLVKLDGPSLQLVLREVASETLIVALKGGSMEVRDKILANMSKRAAEALREDLEGRGPMRLSEVEAQQKEVLKIVRRLADEQQITIGGGAEDAFV